MGRIDYRAGAVSLPLTHRDYVPPADAALRPVVGVGVTPFVGLRIGATATAGPYLNGDLTSAQTAGRSWKSYHQTLIAPDVEYGVGHFDLRAEYDYASYDVPSNGSIVGHAGYVEGRYTVTPRLFVAARGEVNHYPFIRPIARRCGSRAGRISATGRRVRVSRDRIDLDQGQLSRRQVARDTSERGVRPPVGPCDRGAAVPGVRRHGLGVDWR